MRRVLQRISRKAVHLFQVSLQALQGWAQEWVDGWTQDRALFLRFGLNIVIVGLLALVLLTAWVPTASGDLPLLKVWKQQLQQPHHRIERLGNIEIAPVTFENADLFTLASPTVWERSQPQEQLPVEVRAKQVEANLNRVIEGSFFRSNNDGILTNFDPKTLQVSVVSLNDVPVVVATDSYHSQPLKLVTVTYVDADYNGQPVAVLAEQWRSIVYQHLYAALMERSPDALSLHGKLGESLLVLVLTLGASAVLWLLQVPLKQRNRRIRLQQAAIAAQPNSDLVSSEPTLVQLREQFLSTFQQQLALQDQRSLFGFFRWLLAWAQVAVWTIGLMLALTLFPWTKPFAQQVLSVPMGLLLIWFLTSWLNRLTSGLLRILAESRVRFSASTPDDPRRDALRIFTILSALKPVKTLLFYSAGGVFALVYLGLPLGLVLAITGIGVLTLLLVCQPFVKDWVTGCLVLWEDQYAIGDVVVIDQHAGLVERMNLRLTQLHTEAGRLISIANRSIVQVENLTRSWLQRQGEEPAVPKANLGTRLTPSSNGTAFNGADPSDSSEHYANES